MKLVSQTRFGERDGNCTAACLASIFEVPIDQVPDAGPLWCEGKMQEGHDLINAWLIEKFGVEMLQMSPDGLDDTRPAGYWIATTKQGGTLHATVWRGPYFVWNPFPGSSTTGSDLGELAALNFFLLHDPAVLFARGWLSGREAA